MFRYERPQKGRYRQFHQIDLEVMGASEPLADAEVIACGWNILQELEISDGILLEINTLGDAESRDRYRTALVAYFSAHRDALSEDSLTRLLRNPLRILDSKDEGDRRVVASAPVMRDFLTAGAAAFYAKVQDHLGRLGVPFRENHRIVRGLDYYSHTAFEFVTERLGSQGTVMGGGRYNGLVEEMGGPPTPCVGWAAGIERLAMLMEEAGRTPDVPRPVAVIPVTDAQEGPALDLLGALRRAGVVAEIAYRGNLKRRMERANKVSARAAIILGEDEVSRGLVQLRDLDAGTQVSISAEEAVRRLIA
jgi:histidyl-tRNA synthetase